MSGPGEGWGTAVVQVAERTWYVSLVTGVTVFETDEGLVLVDTGMRNLSPQMAEELRKHTRAPVHTVVYTHGHVDHAFGLADFLLEGQKRPRVIAHRSLLERLERYRRTPGQQIAINARQFYGAPEGLVTAEQRAVLHTAFRAPEYPPDTVYDESMTIEVGGLTFDLRHARGETDDHTWLFCPQHRILCPGDLVIWVVPNAGNPQKVQRYPWDWARALREMAALNPASLCPGHGRAVVGDPELVRRILLETAAYLEAIVEQTLAALEDGSLPHVDIVRRVKPPATDSPWLLPIYDEAEFISRNVLRYYGGWYSGRPSELKPASREAVASAVSQMAGGPEAVANRALQLTESGDLRLACHLADYALEADPGNSRVREVVAGIYEKRAASETSLMAINLFRSAAAYARAGRPFV